MALPRLPELGSQAERRTALERLAWAHRLAGDERGAARFAGALREVGLPTGEIPVALFSFNVGIELGQLLFVLVLAVVAVPLVRRIPIPLPQRAAVYVMGSLAAFWMFQRVAAI